MIDDLLAIVAPHHCCGCDKIGTLLCDNCKYDITSETFDECLACASAPAGKSGLCPQCKPPYQQGWCVGRRQDHLQRLIGDYKFNNVRSAYKTLASLLDETLPQLPGNTIIIPTPTVSAHIRQRGYDHMALIAHELAKRRHIRVSTALQRATSTKQRDATKSQRIKQAKEAFMCTETLDSAAIYLLLDDVVTTGATIEYAAKTLSAHGATSVWVAAISRQTLD